MAEFCKACWLAINRDANAADVIETSYHDYCERCGKFGKVVESVRPRAVKGQEYDCPMFDVRCKQPCVSGGERHPDKCPYDNYNAKGAKAMANPKIPKGYQGTYAKNSDGGDTLVMVSREVKMTGSKKGEKSMAKNTTTNKPAGNTGSGKPFEPTFRKYLDMTEGEQAAFRQGAKTTENKVKERLGFTKPRS